jgi:hypothetical protein
MQELKHIVKSINIELIVVSIILILEIGFGLKYVLNKQFEIQTNQAVIIRNQSLIMSKIQEVNEDIDKHKKIYVPLNDQ